MSHGLIRPILISKERKRVSRNLTLVGRILAIGGASVCILLISFQVQAQKSCMGVLQEGFSDEVQISNKNLIEPRAQTLPEAYEVARKLDVVLTPEFLTLSESDQINYLNQVNHEMTKIPPMVLAVISEAGFHMELVLDSVTHHPLLRYLGGVTPRGWSTGWDTVPGAGASQATKCSVIAANSLNKGHGSRNLILHEHAHTFDLALTYLIKVDGRLAYSPARFSTVDETFKDVWRSTDWLKEDEYQRDYVDEAFAESFAFYFDSPDSRWILQSRYPKVFEYFQQRFGSIKDPSSIFKRFKWFF